MHVDVPVSPERDWDEVKRFARGFAERLAADAPERFTANMSKAKRRGRIFVDWLRNQRGATAVMPFSTRSRPNAPVAVPLSWAQLRKAGGGADYGLGDSAAIVAQARRMHRARWAVADQNLPIA